MEAKKLPEADTYEQGLLYWPYKKSQQVVLEKVVELAPKNGILIDIMCGPGNLLVRISEFRPDLKLIGVDVDYRYVEYGNKKYPKINFKKGDVLSWTTLLSVDVIVCTGALHHIIYAQQESAIYNIVDIIGKDKLAIISDSYVDEYKNEQGRKLAAAKLGYEYLQETIANGAPDEVIKWTIDILWNDVLKQEYKTSVAQRIAILNKYFKKVDTFKTWPNRETQYGDYVHVCFS